MAFGGSRDVGEMLSLFVVGIDFVDADAEGAR